VADTDTDEDEDVPATKASKAEVEEEAPIAQVADGDEDVPTAKASKAEVEDEAPVAQVANGDEDDPSTKASKAEMEDETPVAQVAKGDYNSSCAVCLTSKSDYPLRVCEYGHMLCAACFRDYRASSLPERSNWLLDEWFHWSGDRLVYTPPPPRDWKKESVICPSCKNVNPLETIINVYNSEISQGALYHYNTFSPQEIHATCTFSPLAY
jgi:hypothetical protein